MDINIGTGMLEPLLEWLCTLRRYFGFHTVRDLQATDRANSVKLGVAMSGTSRIYYVICICMSMYVLIPQTLPECLFLLSKRVLKNI